MQIHVHVIFIFLFTLFLYSVRPGSDAVLFMSEIGYIELST